MTGTTSPDTQPSEQPAAPAIDVTSRGLEINGENIDVLSAGRLIELFGRPREFEKPASPAAPAPADAGPVRRWLVWDALGIRASARGDEVTELGVQLGNDPERTEKRAAAGAQAFPSGNFSGELSINGGRPLDAVSEDELRKARGILSATTGSSTWRAELFLNETECGSLRELEMSEWLRGVESGAHAEVVRGAAHPVREVTIWRETPKARPKSSGKWKHVAATEPTLEFSNFPFKLAIIQELMYQQKLLTPKFNIHAFAQDQGARSFDPEEYTNRIVPSVRTWFRKLPVPTRLADHVEHLLLDGGNDIYLQLIPYWDGEDASFTIKTLTDADLAPFTRLRSVDDIGGFLSPKARAALVARGIEVTT